jgi:integrase/recombinase XerD
MRVSEVLNLNIEDVMLDAGRESLRVREAKNYNERTVYVGSTTTPETLRGLHTWVRQLKGQPFYAPLFCSNRNTRLSYSAAHYQWCQVCKEAGLVNNDGRPRYTLHQLRHTRGSELIEQGQPMEIVQRVLGHRDLRSTQGYAELSDLQVGMALE